MPYLTVLEVAQRYRLHPATVRRMIHEGEIPAIFVGKKSRKIRIPLDALERTLREEQDARSKRLRQDG